MVSQEGLKARGLRLEKCRHCAARGWCTPRQRQAGQPKRSRQSSHSPPCQMFTAKICPCGDTESNNPQRGRHFRLESTHRDEGYAQIRQPCGFKFHLCHLTTFILPKYQLPPRGPSPSKAPVRVNRALQHSLYCTVSPRVSVN